MPSIKTTSHLWLTMLLAIALAGCGDSNTPTPLSTANGKVHTAAGWMPVGHSATATANLNSCTECHGSDFSGGIAKVSCTQCHLGDQQNVHPLAWGDLSYARHPGYVTENGIASCANIYCHGTALTGITSGVTSSGPSCSSCHIGGPMHVHPSLLTEWSNTASTDFHGVYVKSNGTASCANTVCHGETLLGVNGSGFSCQSCHSLNW